MRHVGVLTGLAAERRIVGSNALALACSGADSGRAEREAADLVATGAHALLSFGLAAGIDAAARPGAIACPAHIVLANGDRLATHRPWREGVIAAAIAAGIAVAGGDIAATDRVLTTAADKSALSARTGALAADMESGATARAAARAGIPHLAVRAIADPAERALPDWTRSAVRADGRIAAFGVAARLALAPWDLLSLARIARDANVGFVALRRVAGLGAMLFDVR